MQFSRTFFVCISQTIAVKIDSHLKCLGCVVCLRDNSGSGQFAASEFVNATFGTIIFLQILRQTYISAS